MKKVDKKMDPTLFDSEYKISSVYANTSISVCCVLSKCRDFIFLGVKMNVSRENLDILYVRLSDMKLIGKLL